MTSTKKPPVVDAVSEAVLAEAAKVIDEVGDFGRRGRLRVVVRGDRLAWTNAPSRPAIEQPSAPLFSAELDVAASVAAPQLDPPRVPAVLGPVDERMEVTGASALTEAGRHAVSFQPDPASRDEPIVITYERPDAQAQAETLEALRRLHRARQEADAERVAAEKRALKLIDLVKIPGEATASPATQVPSGNPNLLTVPEAAKVLRTTAGSIYAAIERGKLPGVVRVGRRVLVDRGVLERSVETGRVGRGGGRR
jgi:excisionase family DNA binding protein